MKTAYHSLNPLWKTRFLEGLEEDHARQDWTTLGALSDPEKPIRAQVVAKAPGIWIGRGLCEVMEEVSHSKIKIESELKDGAQVHSGQIVCSWTGPARLILSYERVALNLMGYFSGIATQTHQLVQEVKKADFSPLPRVTATRKTLPGWRELSLYSVLAGGGSLHRTSLAGGILIKENHIRAAGSLEATLQFSKQTTSHGFKIEIEVTDIKELQRAYENGADAVLLDNFSPEQVQEALDWLKNQKRKLTVEVSGGIRKETILSYVLPGVDLISVGSLTHSVRSLDLSLLVQ